jgi:FMN phosphatase YigB (HAD superfamily)
MKKQNIFIDFDGTICFDYFWRSAPKEINAKIVKFLFHDNVNLIENWMRGKLSSEEVVKNISQNTGLDYTLIWDIFVQDCKNMYVRPDILRAISKCNVNNNTILITDNMDCFNRFTLPQIQFEKYFSYIFNSCDYGTLKDDAPTKGLFKKIIDLYDWDMKKSVLLDNSEKNCKIFSELGGISFLVKNAEDTLSTLKMLE